MNLQAELAYVQSRLAALQRLAPVPVPQSQSSSPTNNHHSSSDLASSNYNLSSMHFDHHHPLQPQAATSAELASFFNPVDHEEVEDGDVQALAREIISRYLPGVRFRPSSPDH